MALRTIVIDYDPVLHMDCRRVVKFNDGLKVFVTDLIETLRSIKGAVGLAAPQVGMLWQVAVVDIGDGPIVLINPKIVYRSGKETAQEGCLSFPNVWADVERPTFVKVRSLDENGRECFFEAEGLKARAFCHEIDHLHGIVFLERAKQKK